MKEVTIKIYESITGTKYREVKNVVKTKIHQVKDEYLIEKIDLIIYKHIESINEIKGKSYVLGMVSGVALYYLIQYILNF